MPETLIRRKGKDKWEESEDRQAGLTAGMSWETLDKILHQVGSLRENEVVTGIRICPEWGVTFYLDTE